MKNKYVFILTIAIICSLLLSLASEPPKPNYTLDIFFGALSITIFDKVIDDSVP